MQASSLRPHRPYSRSQTAHLVPAARFLRPGFAFVTASSSRPGRSARQSAFRTSRDDGSRAAAAGRHSSLRIQVWLENTPLMSEAADGLLQMRAVANIVGITN